MTKAPHLSDCSVASDDLDLDKLTEEDDVCSAQGKRKAASKAVVQQRKILLEGSDGGSADDSEPLVESLRMSLILGRVKMMMLTSLWEKIKWKKLKRKK